MEQTVARELVNRFRTRDSLSAFLRRRLGVDLEKISEQALNASLESFASASDDVEDVMTWARTTGNLRTLHAALRAESSLGHSRLELPRSSPTDHHDIVIDIDPGASLGSRGVGLQEILSGSLRLGLFERRDELLEGLPPEVRGTLPLASTPTAQLYSDAERLSELSSAGGVRSDPSPFVVWLSNAHRLAGTSPEARLFANALDALGEGARAQRTAQIYLSFSPEDQKVASRLIAHFASLVRSGAVVVHARNNVAPGTDLLSARRRWMLSASMVVFLLTPAFLSDPECADELSFALSLEKRGLRVALVIAGPRVDLEPTALHGRATLPHKRPPAGRGGGLPFLGDRQDLEEDLVNVVKELWSHLARRSAPAQVQASDEPPRQSSPRFRARLRQAMINAFPSAKDLKMMGLFEMGERLDALATGPLDRRVHDLIRWADARDRLDDLLIAASRFSRDPELGRLLLQRAVDAPPPSPELTRAVEPFLHAGSELPDLPSWQSRIHSIRRMVCLITTVPPYTGHRVRRAGFLLGRNLLATSDDVVSALESGTRVRGTFAESFSGMRRDFDILPSNRGPADEELEYALLILGDPLAEELADGSLRGFLTLEPLPVNEEETLLVVHPEAGVIVTSGRRGQARRIEILHTVPLPANLAGAPVLRVDLRLVGIIGAPSGDSTFATPSAHLLRAMRGLPD
ncbi:MAG: effector-associated domain EAD1-containing protein [Polyangiaceae bacterium]